MEQFDKRLNKLEGIVEELNKFKWKAVGVISAVVLAVNLLTPSALDFIKSHQPPNPPVKVEDATAGWHLDLTNKMQFPPNR